LDKKLISQITVYYTLILIILSLVPVPDIGLPRFKLLEFDKFIHFIIYLIFALIWGLKIENFLERKMEISAYLILFGLGLEILQHVLPFGRYFDLGDFVANSIGVLFGVFILYYLKKKLL
jgi:VanZ family protein